MSKGVIFLAAGGTGGHLFPAEALAHELIERGWDIHLATDERAQRFTGAFPAEQIHVVRSATIAGRNPVALAKTFWTLWLGNLDSRKFFRTFRPKLVAGFGGYPTLPPLYAASGMKIPTLIHEQNAVMGRANKALAARVNAIAGGFLTDTGGPFAQKTIATGNPVRPAVLAEVGKPYKASQAHQPFHFLVFGGSQGAQYFSTAVPAAIKLLAPEDRARLVVTQQARSEDEFICPLRLRIARHQGRGCAILSRYAAPHRRIPFRSLPFRCVHGFRDSCHRQASYSCALPARP